MEWNRSETLALAAERCASCRGGGRLYQGLQEVPCPCVLRAVFRACYKRFRECLTPDLAATRESLERGATRDAGGSWSRKNEEFVADFLLVSKRSLSAQEHRLFRYHLLLGADWRLCCRRLNMEKGQFFHALYRIQQKLGRIFRELQPYPLYPLADYFSAAAKHGAKARVVDISKARRVLQVPLQRAA